MPSFVDIATLTKLLSLTGNEEFQVSPTQKVTATQIANKVQLAQVLMGGFEAIPINGVEKIKDTNSLIGAMKILYSLSGNGCAKVIGNSENCFGLVSINTAGTLAFGILFDIRSTTPPSIFIRDGFGLTGGASLKNLTDDQWIAELKKGKKIPMESGSGVADPIQIHDFAEVSAIDNWPTPKDGLIIPFVTDSGVLNKPGNESEYVGIIIICEVDTQNTGRAEVIAYGSGTGACYVGLLDYTSVSIEWRVNKLSVASRKLSAFTESAIFEYIYQGDDGDVFPFTTINATKSTANQFPANGLFTGIISKGSNEGDYFNILAFRNGSNEVYVGSCIGSTTQWTLVGGSGGTPSGGIAPGTVIFNDEFSFDGYTSANPGQLSLLQPIPLGSIVTFIGSYYFGPPAEEILLSPESPTWSLTVALPTGVSSIAHYLKDMLVVQNPDTNLVVARQSAIYKIDAKNLVNGKISTIDMYATGALLSDMYLTIDQIIYVAQV